MQLYYILDTVFVKMKSGGTHPGEAGAAQAVGRPANKQRLQEGLRVEPIENKKAP